MCAVLAAPMDALAAGNGLYEPFPTAGARKRAKRFVDGFRAQRPVSDAELDRGAFDPALLRPAPAGAASGRALGSGGPSTASVWIVLAALLAVCAVPALRRE